MTTSGLATTERAAPPRAAPPSAPRPRGRPPLQSPVVLRRSIAPPQSTVDRVTKWSIAISILVHLLLVLLLPSIDTGTPAGAGPALAGRAPGAETPAGSVEIVLDFPAEAASGLPPVEEVPSAPTIVPASAAPSVQPVPADANRPAGAPSGGVSQPGPASGTPVPGAAGPSAGSGTAPAGGGSI